jgi:hypothetical protein
MPHLTSLSLTLPRLERLEGEALAALTGLTRLELHSSRKPQYMALEMHTNQEAEGMPRHVGMSALVHLQGLELEYVAAGEVGRERGSSARGGTSGEGGEGRGGGE